MANGQATDGYLVALLFTKIPSLYNCNLFELQLQLQLQFALIEMDQVCQLLLARKLSLMNKLCLIFIVRF